MAGLHVPLSTLRHRPRGPSTHDSGPSWIATPSMSGVLIPFLMPVYPGAFPTFTTTRSTRSVPSYTPAASPAVRRSPSPWPPRPATTNRLRSRPPPPRRACTADRPTSARFRAGTSLTERQRWFLAYTFSSCLPDPARLAVPARPGVVRAAPTLACVSTLRLPSASPACCDRPAAGPFHPRPVVVAPRGAGSVGRRRPATAADGACPAPASSPDTPPDGLHPSLGVSVRSRRPDRRADDLCAFGAEYIVEGASELGVVVAEQEPGRQLPVVQIHRGVPGLLGNPGGVGPGL